MPRPDFQREPQQLQSKIRHNTEAEESLLGAMLLSRAAVEIGVDSCAAGDFYRPVHGYIFGAMKNLYDGGVSIDAVTVTDELQRMGLLEAVGDPAIFIRLQADTPSIANAKHYVSIIRRESNARLVMTAMGQARNALEDQGEPSEVVDQLEEQLRSIDRGGQLPERYWRSATDYTGMEHAKVGKPLIEGLCYQHTRVIVLATEKSGKALALNTPIPTPSGWKTMGDLEEGDFVFGDDGKPRKIVATTETMYGHRCFEVCFSDGEKIVADADHLWSTIDYAARQPKGSKQPSIHTTEDLSKTVEARGGITKNHQIPTCAPLDYFPQDDLSVAPYTLGAWLGDGDSLFTVITCHPTDTQIIDEIEADGYTVRPLKEMRWHIGRSSQVQSAIQYGLSLVHRNGLSIRHAADLAGIGNDRLRKYMRTHNIPIPGVYGCKRPDTDVHQLPTVRNLRSDLSSLGVKSNKHIPRIYLESSIPNRLALLQGLMDTDGTISDKKGMSRCEFSVVSKRLAEDVYELVVGLGIKATFHEGTAKLYGREVSRRYRIAFQTELPVFRLRRKLEKQSPLLTSVSTRRAIVSVGEVDSVPVRCIQVDHEDGMYVAGRHCVPTHNSMALRQIAFCAAAGIHPFTFKKIDPVRILLLDAENDDEELVPTMKKIRQMVEGLAGEDALAPALLSAPYGMDLRKRRDRSELEEVLEDYRPQIIIGGPIYKLLVQQDNTSDPRHAERLQQIFDDIRKRWGCALFMEHHAPAGKQGETRELRSIGGQRWAAWPEVTIALHGRQENGVDGVDVKFPHPPRGWYNWPRRFERATRSSEWPWTPIMRTADVAPPPQEAPPLDGGF
jgi:replicative DNA helicase